MKSGQLDNGLKYKFVQINEPGRDQGKIFKITEWDVFTAEKWAARLICAMVRGGVDVPEGVLDMGMAGVTYLGARALGNIQYEDAEPLLDMMLSRIEYCPDQSKPELTRKLGSAGAVDILELKTLFILRSEVIELHTGFSVAGELSKGPKTPADTSRDSSDTQTSQS